MKLYKQRYLCKECLKTWSARTDIVEEGHTLSHQLKRSVLHMARRESLRQASPESVTVRLQASSE